VTPEHWKRVGELFEAALEHEPAARAEFLARAAAGDAAIADEVFRLLASDKNAGTFLSTPPGLDPLAESAERVTLPAERGPGDGSATLGHFEIGRRIGGGGMGVVFEARDTVLGRTVAVKLVRPGSSDEKARARLLREAQTLARLKHPNVVTVFEVGTAGEEIFIAMELVEGGTLREWMREPRDWREVVDLFLAVGRGLAAAHALGFVHRDVKPSNIFLDRDGTPKIGDFGLVSSPSVPEGDRDQSGRSVLEIRVTTSMFGTPAYMSPEQLQGGRADARADQFAYCVSLHEALTGKLPGRDGEALPMPRRLRPILARGLAPSAEARYPSMDALLADLLRVRRGHARAWLAMGVAAAMVAIGAGAFAVARSRPACIGAERAWGDLWSTPYREPARVAFGSSAAEFARVDSALQALRRAWIEMRTDACLATHVRGEQSEALLDLRVQCLDDRRREVEALARLFQSAKPAVVAHADDAIDNLTPLSRCADARALTSRLAPPSDAEGRARVEEAKGLIARAKALLDTGGSAAALPIAEQAVNAAQRASYKPVEAEALLLRAQALRPQLRYDEATASAHAASAAAIEGHDDGAAADAFTLLLMLQGYDQGRAAGEVWSQYARAAIARLGGDDLREGDLEDRLANIYMNDLEHLELSRSHRLKALALFRKAGAPEEKIAYVEAQQATAEAMMGHLEESERLLQNAIDVQARHGRVNAGQWMNLGEILILAERPQEAQQAIERGLEVFQRENGRRSSYAVHHLAWALRESGRLEEALRLDREALDDFEKQGVAAYWMLLPLSGLGEDLIRLGRPREAIAPLERAVRLSAENKIKALEAGLAQFALARALWESGADRNRARAVATDAREVFRGPAQKYGSFYARRLGEVERWLADRTLTAR
jgi:tetratricopeptide (TPR) repeat protein